ncbi:MAG: phage head-tail connector protein [Proteobacteria bacterium]|nr:phage head-tail connector protein [Pseudomonadota bacterium]
MPSLLLTGPAIEPWSVAEAKSYLRAENDDDDTVIASLISAARNQVEALTRCALIAQTWRFVRDQWPQDGRIKLGRGPLRTLGAARVYDSSGNANTIDAGMFVLDKAGGVIAAPSWALPMPGRASAGIELDVELGFGTAAADVPDVLRHAIRTLVAHWYENRGLIAIGQTVAMMPGSVNAMIAAYRVRGL